MPNPNVYPPAPTDMTQQFESIVEAQPSIDAATPAPVAGELGNAKTFDPKDLPEGALLLRQDRTNPNLPRIVESSSEDMANGARGEISIDPNCSAMNMLHVRDPHGNKHRIFLSREGLTPEAVMRWFVEEKGYVIPPVAIDFDNGDSSPRHALREESAPQANAPEWHWFEPSQQAPYHETDTAVTGSHYPSIREALAGEAGEEITAEVAPNSIPAIESVTPETPEPGDWRVAAQKKFEGQPLPLGEQMTGMKAAVLAVGPSLSRNYVLAPEQVTAAFEELDDYTRWQAIFPDHEAYAETPEFKPFSPVTSGIIHSALEEVIKNTPEEKAIAALRDRPRQELSLAENAELDRLLELQRLAPVAQAIKEHPTLLTTDNQQTHLPRQRDRGESTKIMIDPRHQMDAPLKRTVDQTAIMQSTVARQTMAFLTQKGKALISQGVAKLKNLRRKQQAIVA